MAGENLHSLCAYFFSCRFVSCFLLLWTFTRWALRPCCRLDIKPVVLLMDWIVPDSGRVLLLNLSPFWSDRRLKKQTTERRPSRCATSPSSSGRRRVQSAVKWGGEPLMEGSGWTTRCPVCEGGRSHDAQWRHLLLAVGFETKEVWTRIVKSRRPRPLSTEWLQYWPLETELLARPWHYAKLSVPPNQTSWTYISDILFYFIYLYIFHSDINHWAKHWYVLKKAVNVFTTSLYFIDPCIYPVYQQNEIYCF